MSHDTTFNLREFYVSPLVYKYIMFEEQPLVAYTFLIHEQNLEETVV